MIGLADCNNFFVSCERTVHPELIGKAVVVMSNNDGCIVARSNEAKRLGIKMGQPVFEIRDMVRRGEVTAISGHHLLYKEISVKVHSIMRRYVPSTIDYSVDEAFLDVDGIPAEVIPTIGRDIVAACLKEAKIPVTVGFAPTKTLAKVVTEQCKKRGESVGMLTGEEERKEALLRLPIGEVWGIGRRLAKRMYLEGIHTAADFALRDRSWVQARYGVNGVRSWLELNGTPCITLSHVGRALQDSISESRTFPFDVDDYDYLRARIAMYADHCSRRLRKMHGLCRELTVMLRTNRFHTEKGYFAPEMTVVFDTPVCDTITIVGASIAALERIFDPSLRYKRGGIILSDIIPGDCHTPSLFAGDAPARMEKMRRLSQVIDRINSGDGPPVIPLAAEIAKEHPGHNDGYSSTFQFQK